MPTWSEQELDSRLTILLLEGGVSQVFGYFVISLLSLILEQAKIAGWSKQGEQGRQEEKITFFLTINPAKFP